MSRTIARSASDNAPIYDSDSSTDTGGDWSEDSDQENAPDNTATASTPDNNQIFATPQMQSAVHAMLTHLQEWWEHSEGLLQLMADKQLPCNSLKKMSDDIDTMLDKSISKLIETYSSDPSHFPISVLIDTTRTIKKYLFMKVGEVCCQAGKGDDCAKAAKAALLSLKKFRNSATNFYDEMLSHLVQGMSASDNAAPTSQDFDTPQLEALMDSLRLNDKPTSK